jgi:hypothetical protein
MLIMLTGTITSVFGADLFLKGNYVEVGIHNAGSFGSSSPAPPGFHPKVSPYDTRLGFVADPGKDGWGVGTPPQTGDYFVPGTPEEGWMLQWTGADGLPKPFYNFGLMGQQSIATTRLANTSSGSTQSAVWQGTATTSGGTEKLQVVQTVSFDVDALYFTINVVMTNTGTATLRGLKYMRNVDPDQEQPLTSNFTTRNWVEFQPPRIGVPGRPDLAAYPAGNTNKALAVAEGLTYRLTLGLGTIDPRAVVAASHGFSNRNVDQVLSYPTQPTPSNPSVRDAAIVLAYELGDLAPGQSTSVTYAYILNKSDLSVAMGNLAAVSILQPSGTVSGDNVPYQATTDKVDHTTRMDFYANGSFIGSDTTPDAGGVFETKLNSRSFANGTVSLRVVATFDDGTSTEKLSSVTVDNSGPPVAFATPVSGQIFSGAGIPARITVLDPNQPPVRVSFFRETAATGSRFLGEDTAAPFETSFSVTDLPQGETVVIKAVATDSLGRMTTITVSGVTESNHPPIANAGPDQSVLCAGGSRTVTLDGSASVDPDGDTLTFRWSGSFGTAEGVKPAISLPLGTHEITLVVTDPKGLTSSDTVAITVYDNVPPTIATGPDVVIEATGSTGAAYTPRATVTDNCCVATALDIKPNLTVFPLGATTVTFTASDCAGNTATATQTITVVDTTPPVVTPPAALTAEATGSCTAVTTGTATATDYFPVTIGSNAPTCFPLGATVVTWTATDANGNKATATQTVTVVDTTPPVVTPPSAVSAEATGSCTVVATGTAKATDLFPVTVASNAPTCFPLGTTVVTWTATDANGNKATATQTVSVVDTTPPAVTPPSAVSAEATGNCTVVATGTAKATDLFPVTVVSNAPTCFPLGTTVVTWTATDANGNKATATQTVSVVDTTPPVLSGLSDQTLEATSASGSIATYSAGATDKVDPAPAVLCSPVSGSTFAIGSTKVTCTATDFSGNKATGSFTITVRDTTPPVIKAPQPITVTINTPVTAPSVQAFLSGARASDTVDPNVMVTVTGSYDLTHVGTYTLTFTAVDHAGNTSAATSTITVRYGFGGFLQPVTLGKPFKLGSTIPVKFQLVDASGSIVTTATARFYLQKYLNNEPVGDPIEVTSTSSADTGNYFRLADGMYLYNLATRGLTSGMYQIQAILDDGTTQVIWLELKS